jgi:hypothetical protein
MSKYLFIVIFSIVFCFGQIVEANAQSSGSVSVSLTDKRKIITRSINKNLLLRVVKDSSIKHKHFGWLVEVVRQPYRRNSRNLIYTNPAGVGADPSQIYAWHITENEFPNEREIKVRGYPYSVKISLINGKTAGNREDARFVSGTLQINWRRQN